MHMASCENRRGQFKKLERDERDRIIARFRQIIEKLRARMLFSSVSREVWQKVASSTVLGEVFPDPIDFCFNGCMRHALESRRTEALQALKCALTDAKRKKAERRSRRNSVENNPKRSSSAGSTSCAYLIAAKTSTCSRKSGLDNCGMGTV